MLKCGVCGGNMGMANAIKYRCTTNKDGVLIAEVRGDSLYGESCP
ncbi:MAG: hypothetical protein ABW166_15720 [Sedimenticola sp.]